MQELLRHLRANGFRNFIVSGAGGGADFMRIWVERVYGIPQVIGSTTRTTSEIRDNGPVLTKTLDYFIVEVAGRSRRTNSGSILLCMRVFSLED